MIPNITRGGNVTGVLSYLLGKGRREEHQDPHLVAGSPSAIATHGERTLAARDAGEIGRFLDAPRLASGEQVSIPKRDENGRAEGSRDGHVWHCSLSLHPEEPDVGEERWRELVEAFVARMGFDSEQRGGCRWVAIHHGRSNGGSDHVHVVVQLVREDGLAADVFRDRIRAQAACRELERQFGLRQVEARGRDAGERGVKAGELAGDRRRGLPVGESDEHPERGSRRTLERVVRACGAAARDELDFVARLRSEGLLVRPRYASQSTSDVVGYSVALRPTQGQAPVWYGGGRVSRELTLPRLRENWPDVNGTAVANAWRAQATSTPEAGRPRTRRSPSREVQERCATELAALRERLLEIPAQDTATWAHVAREAAGVFAAWSLQTESTPGPLAETSRVLARSAQLRRSEVQRRWRSLPAARYTSALLLAAAPEARAALLIFRQLAGLSTAMAEMHEAVGELDRARELQELSRGHLATVIAELQAREVRAHTAQIIPEHRPAEHRPGARASQDVGGRDGGESR